MMDEKIQSLTSDPESEELHLPDSDVITVKLTKDQLKKNVNIMEAKIQEMRLQAVDLDNYKQRNEEMQKSIAEKEKSISELSKENRELIQRLAANEKQFKEELDESKRDVDKFITALAECKLEWAKAMEKVEILTDSKMALIELYTQAVSSANQSQSQTSIDLSKLQRLISKLGWDT